MSETTPNIGLKKPLESEFVDIGELNGNMDAIDQAMGAMSQLPTAAKSAAGAIAELNEHVKNKPSQQVTLKNGVQMVQGGDLPAILHPTMKGRTLVNLLGRDGNCEDASKWNVIAAPDAVSALDSNNKAYGNNSLKLTWNKSTQTWTALSRNITSLINPSKYYLVLGDVKNGNTTWAKIGFLKNGNLTYYDTQNITDSSMFSLSYARVGPNELAGMTSMDLFLVINVSGPGQFAFFDGIRLYEVSQAEYDAIPSMTRDEVATKYPYVDDMKHVNAVYIENKGKNLLPPFSEAAISSGCVITDSYKIDVSNTSDYGGATWEIDIPLGTTYTFSLVVEGYINTTNKPYYYIDEFDKNGNATGGISNLMPTNGLNVTTFTTSANTRRLRIATWKIGNGFFKFASPMLNIGSEALPFEPQKPSYLYLPDCNLRSDLDGSVADRLYTDGQGRPRATRRFREMVLDGTLGWVMAGNYSGYKYAEYTLPVASTGLNNSNNLRCVKYDGKVLFTSGITTGADQVAVNSSNRVTFGISIAESDSGWGDSYTPTADEIKAYFWGWKMYPQGGLSTDKFSSGTKLWCRRSEVGLTLTDVRTSVPAEMSLNFTPYRLMYQLAQSVDEPVTYEGALMLHEGDNQVEVGTGVVVREVANPTTVNGKYFINGSSAAPMKYRVNKMVRIYKFQEKDDWKFANQPYSTILGLGYGEIPEAHFDKTGAYSSTYLALDTYTLGIVPQTISAEYAPNIRESVESLVREAVEARTETSVLRNTKAQKQPPQWISATLLNGWTNRYGAAGYYKDDSGIVHLKGFLQNGAVAQGTVLFYLPKGYRPSQLTPISTITYSTNSDASPFAVSVDLNGSVTLTFVAKSFVPLDGISFRAEQ
ncbi:hypothetical protein [Cohnella boryungensis]|uniref:Tail fiber protein n=1 Tax=Cohnella boryungensis TaxID=768479 RepID=A0ABV8S6H9_9BACL